MSKNKIYYYNAFIKASRGFFISLNTSLAVLHGLQKNNVNIKFKKIRPT
jgi:hypothetical protein